MIVRRGRHMVAITTESTAEKAGRQGELTRRLALSLSLSLFGLWLQCRLNRTMEGKRRKNWWRGKTSVGLGREGRMPARRRR
jgi:hypothetical protein